MRRVDPSKELLKFIFSKVGENSTDADLALWAHGCQAAFTGLLCAMSNDRAREKMLAEQSDLMADCIRRTVEVIDAVEAGDVEVITPKESGH